jgi:Ca2+-binding EF-hand superfamily protein
MKATSLLKKQHQEVKSLFRKIDRTEDGSARQDLMNQIIQKLTAHSTIEEEIFYPAVRGLETHKAEEVILEALEEHHVVKLVLDELPTVDPEDEHFGAKMTVLSELVEHHADEEEDEMFKLAAKLGDGELEALGARMTARMEELSSADVQETGARSGRR